MYRDFLLCFCTAATKGIWKKGDLKFGNHRGTTKLEKNRRSPMLAAGTTRTTQVYEADILHPSDIRSQQGLTSLTETVLNGPAQSASRTLLIHFFFLNFTATIPKVTRSKVSLTPDVVRLNYNCFSAYYWHVQHFIMKDTRFRCKHYCCVRCGL